MCRGEEVEKAAAKDGRAEALWLTMRLTARERTSADIVLGEDIAGARRCCGRVGGCTKEVMSTTSRGEKGCGVAVANE